MKIDKEKLFSHWISRHPIILLVGGFTIYTLCLIGGVSLCAMFGGMLAWLLM